LAKLLNTERLYKNVGSNVNIFSCFDFKTHNTYMHNTFVQFNFPKWPGWNEKWAWYTHCCMSTITRL